MISHLRAKNGKVVCADCGAELEPQPGKQERDSREPIEQTQLAYILFCPNCESPKGEWADPEERDEAIRATLAIWDHVIPHFK